jgi:hypothetical protein
MPKAERTGAKPTHPIYDERKADRLIQECLATTPDVKDREKAWRKWENDHVALAKACAEYGVDPAAFDAAGRRKPLRRLHSEPPS